MATCCVTGHRNLIDEKHVYEELYKAVNINVQRHPGRLAFRGVIVSK